MFQDDKGTKKVALFI